MKLKSLALALIAAVSPAFSEDRYVKHVGIREGRKDGLDPEQVKAALTDALKERDTRILALIEKSNKEIEEKGKVTEETKAKLAEQVKQGAELMERLSKVEQEFTALKEATKNATRVAGKSIGEQFTDNAAFKDLAEKGRGTARMHVKTINTIGTAGGTGGTGAAGGAVVPDRLPDIISPALRQFTIRDLLLPGRTSSNLIDYVQETGFQNEAAMQVEGTAKAQSDLTFALLSSPVRTLAHYVRASLQILADVPQLQSYIDTRLTYGLKYVEEMQLLSGDGTGQNLLGLIPQSTAFDTTKTVAGDTKIDTIRRAILQVRIAEFRATAIVLNPTDWADIEMQKDTIGRYVWVNVQAGGIPQLWRLPVVDSSAMPAGYFMVGAFNLAAQIFDREDANIQVSTEDGNNFTQNLVTIRAEERLALVVFRPQSFVYGEFPEVGTEPVT
jgi:HK97 family phage major capsid protein